MIYILKVLLLKAAGFPKIGLSHSFLYFAPLFLLGL